MRFILNKIFTVTVFTLALFPQTSRATPWSLNDVTYVYAMPQTQELANQMIHLNTRSLRDNQALIEPVPFAKILGGFYESMTLLAARIDPCFRDLFTDSCRRQIRLVWQPLMGFNQKIISIDVALHTFYDLNDTEFLSLMQEIQALKVRYQIKTDRTALDVHPGFKSSIETDFQKEFNRMLLTKIGFSNTSRIAVMRMGMRGLLWEFQSFDVKHGVLRSTFVPGTRSLFQRFANVAPEGEFHSNETLTDAAKNEQPDQLMRVLNHSSDPAVQTPEALKLYLGRSIRLEQTNIHLPGTIDCISCHASNNVKVWAANKLTQIGIPVDLTRKPSRHNWTNRSRSYGPTSNFRALGYIADHLQISDRTIYESAEVADTLNRLEKRK